MTELYRNPNENAEEYAPAEPITQETPSPLDIDRDWLIGVLVRLLQTPSPTGRTDAVMQFVGDVFTRLGVPFTLTRRGALVAELPGEASPTDTAERAIVVHADTIGCMVQRLKPNGRLELTPIGTHSARFAAGARVKLFVDGPDRVYTGTVLPLMASGHRYNDAVDSQPGDWEHVELRIDEPAENIEDLRRLGVQVGDFVALVATPEVTESGYIVSRHLDGKAGVAAALAVAKAITENGIVLPHKTNIMVTISEEVGHGASHGLVESVAELVSLDNAVVAPEQESIEDGVTLLMADLHGPYDYHLTRRLHSLARSGDIPCVRDVFRHYRSDAAAAIEAGAGTRAALLGFGVDGSHGWERTTIASVEAVARLVTMWLRTKLTFAKWDASPEGELEGFPSALQPAPVERWTRLAPDEHPAGQDD